ncbi:AfsR/SARP family transcriptional regulator [Streptomyces chartreusis]|uniref:AfsR/SARP family transcriptional regulator n=1 Tax=Streptomyces chartreusis TaxID=1969 RepID=UPI0036C22319
MRFQLLGPLSLTDGQDSVVLAPSRPTNLLASLLLHANSVVCTDYLLRAVWGEVQPATSKAALQTCVLRLRRLFVKHGVTQIPIEAMPGGYRITARKENLDLIGFRGAVADAKRLAGDPEGELRLLKGALAMWQGSLLANVRSDALHRDEVPRLTEERLRTVERICDLELALGRCGEALVELWGATRAYPGHERFREQLIEGLYRTGRQAEALAEYRHVKKYLLDELGVDPSPALQRLELAILRGDDLGRVCVDRPAVTLTSQPTEIKNLGLPELEAAASPAVLRRLPAVPSFSGRAADVSAVVSRLTEEGDGPRIVLICGAPGIGKTALASHVAHLIGDHFPDGQLLVSLCDPDGMPRHPRVAAAEVASHLRERGSGKRVLLILDDALNAAQIRPLLPTGPSSAAIVTSRRRLAGLVATHGGWVHRLGPLDETESQQLLQSVLGAERVAAEQEAARQLAVACGHYPLALRIVGARLLTRPGLSMADGACWLADDPLARLALADDPGMSVERVFAGALQRLAPSLAAVFLWVGSLPLDIRAEDIASVLGITATEADDSLERLADAGLLEDGPPGPYRVHDLLRLYAQRAFELSHPHRRYDLHGLKGIRSAR